MESTKIEDCANAIVQAALRDYSKPVIVHLGDVTAVTLGTSPSGNPELVPGTSA